MKKYIQLCLVIIAFLCFLLMAMYERKYSHLQTVIRFMQWPASPTKIDCLSVHCQTNDNDILNNLHWVEAAPGLYTYSAFLLRNQTTVQILSLRHSTSDNMRILCSFLHEGGTDFSNTYARTVPMRQFGDWNLNLLSCPASKEKNHAKLNGVGLSVTDSTPEWMLHVQEPVFNSSVVVEKSLLVFCVKPLSVGFADTPRLLEFIELARSAGVHRISFYHRGLGIKSRNLLKHEIRNGFVQLLPFYLPLGVPVELVDSIALLDCFLRNSLEPQAKVIQMGMNDFFTPTGDRIIQTALPKRFSGLVTFKTHIYCMEIHDDIVARTLHFPFLTLRKMKRLKDSTVRSLLVVEAVEDAKHLKLVKEALDPQKISGIPSTTAVSRNGMILKHYGKCRSNRISYGLVSDTYMMKFKDKFFKKLALYS